MKKKGREQMHKLNRVFAAFLAAALSACILSGCGGTAENSSAEQPATTTTAAGQSAVQDSGNINIPGFESLEFKAGETKQTSKLHNPAENSCYFRMTLTIDGEAIWQSDDIAPGEQVGEMELTRALDAGEYAAKLKYECFTMQDKTPLNGAEIDLAINVK